jgi:hypothetical protein
MVHRFIAERAFRWHIADEPAIRPGWLRPRIVDKEAFAHEEQEFAGFHESQRGSAPPVPAPPPAKDDVA